MRKRFIIYFLLFALSASAKNNLEPFNPAGATLLSEKDNLMSHAPSTVITENGVAYVAYYFDKSQYLETGNDMTVELWMDSFKVSNWKKPSVSRQLIMKYGMTVGDYTQAVKPPYDPSLANCGDSIAVVFQGHEDNDEGRCYCLRMYDKKSSSFSNSIQRCRFRYDSTEVPLSVRGMKKAFLDLGLGETEGFHQAVLNYAFIKSGDYWYNVISVWCCPQARPIIVRTRDFVTYEKVFVCNEFAKGSAETAIELYGGEFYVISRSARPKLGKGTYMAKYSADGTCLVKPYKIGEIESRPAMKVYDGKLLAFYNAGPELVTKRGKVRRSRMRISEINEFAVPVRSWDVTNESSIQYYNLSEYKNALYLTFVEDRFFRKFSQLKGNVAFIKTNL